MAAQPTPIPAATRPRPAEPLAAAGTTDAARVAVLLAAPAVGAVCLLLALGALAVWGQARGLGLAPVDVLPLASLGELLTLGVQALLVAVAGVPIALALAYVGRLALARGIRPLLEDDDRFSFERRRIERDLAALSETGGDDQAAVERRARRLSVKTDRLRAAARRRLWITRGLVAAGLVLAVVFGGPAHLLAAAVAVVVLQRFDAPWSRVAGVVLVVLVVAAGAERLLASPDPATVTIRTTTGDALVKGALVGASDQAWHVKVAPGVLKSVPAATIAKSSVTYPPGSDPRPLTGSFAARVW